MPFKTGSYLIPHLSLRPFCSIFVVWSICFLIGLLSLFACRVPNKRAKVYRVKKALFSQLLDRDTIARLFWHPSPCKILFTGQYSSSLPHHSSYLPIKQEKYIWGLQGQFNHHLNCIPFFDFLHCSVSLSYSEGQSAAIPVASMEFAAICLRNSLLLLPEHQQQDVKMENSSKSSSQSGSTESGSENSDACRYDIHTHTTRYSYKYKHMQGEDVTNITTTIYWTVILRFKKKNLNSLS